MASSSLLIFFCSILLHLVALTIAQNEKLDTICSTEQGNFTANSTYQANLNHLLSSLSSSTKVDSGFFNLTYGSDINQVNAMGLCRGDVKPDSCRSCITNATIELPKTCPNQKEAVIWFDNCMLRYSNRLFFGKMEFYPRFWMYNLKNVSDVITFNQAVGSLLDGLKNKAASGGSVRKFATGNANTTDSQKIYALVQCTPDLSKQDCITCLNNATAFLPKCCNGKIGGRVIAPSCNFRYEMNLFYDVTADAPITPPSPSPLPSTPTPPAPAQPPSSRDQSPTPSGPPPTAAPAQPPASKDESPPPSGTPPTAAPAQPPASSPDQSSPSPGPPPMTAQPPASQDESSPPPPSNSATQKGKASHSTSATFVLVLVPLLLWKYT